VLEILVVTADNSFLEAFRKELESQGLSVQTSDTLNLLLETLKVRRPQILVLDLDLSPDPALILNSLHLDRHTARLPIMAITGRHTAPRQIIAGLRLGAMEYILKPADPRVVAAKLQSLLNSLAKQRKVEVKEPVLKTADGSLSLDMEGHRCLLGTGANQKELSLTPKEFILLAHLISKTNRLVAKNDLLHTLWPDQPPSSANAVILAQFIGHLRKKLGSLKSKIKTIWGLGYRFEG